MINLKGEKNIKVMLEGGKILGQMLQELGNFVKPGITTNDIDKLAKELVFSFAKKYPKAKIQPAFLGYNGFPAHICISVNDEVVHGIPSEKVLNEGDVVGLDFGITYYGWNLDSAITVGVGKISRQAQKLLEATKKALEIGIDMARAGNKLGDLGFSIQKFLESNDFAVVRDLVGHGIGEKLHEDPYVPNYGEPGEGEVLKEGMVIAIEPMATLGDWHVALDKDGWTWRTKDKSIAAHFEHTVAITKDGPLVLTSH